MTKRLAEERGVRRPEGKTHEEERRPLRPLRMREAGEPPGAWERPGVAEAAMTTAENIKGLPGGDKEETREGLTLHFLNAIADGPGRKTDTGQYPDKPPPGFVGFRPGSGLWRGYLIPARPRKNPVFAMGAAFGNAFAELTADMIPLRPGVWVTDFSPPPIFVPAPEGVSGCRRYQA